MSENNDDGKGAPTDPLEKYQEIIKPLLEKHGDIAIYPQPKPKFDGIIVLAAPLNSAAYQVYTNNLHKEQSDKFVEAKKFALACIVHPEQAIAKQILEYRPALVSKFANRGGDLCGNDTEELGKD